MCCPPVWLVKKLKKTRWQEVLVCVCYKGILQIMGLHVRLKGAMSDTRPLLLVTNHLSYLDVVVLGSQVPVRFAPKIEIAHWPVIGWICRLCDAVFIDRNPRKTDDAKQVLRSALGRGEVVCLFPESTTGTGMHLQTFRSSLFSLAEAPIGEHMLSVQPAAIIYTCLSRLPIDSTQWPVIAWYGDMELIPHVWNLLKQGRLDAELVFLPQVTLADHPDRKLLAAHCQKAVAEEIQRARNEARKHTTQGVYKSLRGKLLRSKS